MNIRIMKDGVEVGYLENVMIKMLTNKSIYCHRDMLKAEITTKDEWTVSVLYMLQYLSDHYTYEVY